MRYTPRTHEPIGEDPRGWLARVSDWWAEQRDPVRAVQRRLARNALAYTYKAANADRLHRARSGQSGSGDRHLDNVTLERLRNYCRDLDRNNGVAKGLLDRWVDNVVDTGFTLQARTKSKTWNHDAEEYFNHWADDRADIRGMLSFWQMQRLALRSVGRDGDVFMVLTKGQLQAVEGDRIVTPNGANQRGNITNGVEMNAVGRPVGFWVAPYDRSGSRVQSAEAVRYPAEDVIHLVNPLRFSQSRGVPVLAENIRDFDDLDGYLAAEKVAARIAACFGVLIKKDNAAAYGGLQGATEDNESDTTQRVEELEPGMIEYLEPGEDIVQVDPKRPGEQFGIFVETMLRFLGLPLGLPLELVLLDFSRTNYSSARAAFLQAYKTFRGWQRFIESRLLRRVYRWQISHAIKMGRLRERADAWAHEWIAPGWEWVDPLREVKADEMAVNAGFKTLADVAAKQGKDWMELLVQRKSELDKYKELGLDPPVHDKPDKRIEPQVR